MKPTLEGFANGIKLDSRIEKGDKEFILMLIKNHVKGCKE